MSKHNIKLRLKDMYAIKHALQLQIRMKQEKIYELSKITNIEGTCQKSCSEYEIGRVNKDIQHEEWLLQTVVNEIEEYKSKIKLSNWCGNRN